MKAILISLIVFVCVVLGSTNSNASSRYWVGGSNALWSVATNWNSTSSSTVGGGNGAVPIAGDDVYFDANSATGAGGAINVTSIIANIAGLHSLNITGTTTNVTFSTVTTLITISLNIGAASNALVINSGCTLVLYYKRDKSCHFEMVKMRWKMLSTEWC